MFLSLKDYYYSRMMLLAVFAVLSGIALVEGNDARCPQEMPYQMKTYQEFCFQFVNVEMYWPDANNYCINHGGRLATINSAETNQFITNTLSNVLRWSRNGVWIGLHDQRNEHTWEWSTEVHRIHEPLGSFTNWGRGHPVSFLNRMKDCVRMTRKDGWKWHETACALLNWKYSFICQYKMKPTTTEKTTPSLLLVTHKPALLALNNKNKPSTESEAGQTTDVWSHGGKMDIINPSGKSRKMDIPEVHDPNSAPQVGAQKERKEENNMGMLVGIVILALCLVVCLLIIIMFLLYRRRRKNADSPRGSISNPVYEGANAVETPPPSMPSSPIHHDEGQHLLKVCGGATTSCMDEEGACGGSDCGAGDTCCSVPPAAASKKNQRAQNFYVDSSDIRNMGAAALPPKKRSARDLPVPPLPDESAALYESTEDLKNVKDNDVSNSIDGGYLDPRKTDQYVPMKGSQTSEEAEELKVEYDTPKPENIYAEIPERQSRLYEDCKDSPYHSVA